ncbi:MAG: uracil-DNA glycosylase [Thermodesulfovibrionales bacterium]
MGEISREELGLVLEFYRHLGIESIYVESDVGDLTGGQLRTGEKKKALEDLMVNVIGECTRCGLSEERTNIVFGEGSADCEIMFIGEGPGADEDKQGRPFVGRAGQVLTNLIKKMGFERKDVYIANIVKCRPPDNRNPSTDEADTCIPFLKKQIEIIQPKVIMLLGNVPLQNFFGSELRITKARGKFVEYSGIKVMPTFHPSYLMRNPKDKWLTWEDAVAVLKYIGRDIADQST